AVAIAALLVFELERAVTVPLTRLLSGDAWLAVSLAFALFLVVSILLHELGHALTCKAFGREIRRGGFMLFFGFPACFVDTSDIWLDPRRRRIAVSGAGATVDATVAAAGALRA